jgi:hypothetical protein
MTTAITTPHRRALANVLGAVLFALVLTTTSTGAAVAAEGVSIPPHKIPVLELHPNEPGHIPPLEVMPLVVIGTTAGCEPIPGFSYPISLPPNNDSPKSYQLGVWQPPDPQTQMVLDGQSGFVPTVNGEYTIAGQVEVIGGEAYTSDWGTVTVDCGVLGDPIDPQDPGSPDEADGSDGPGTKLHDEDNDLDVLGSDPDVVRANPTFTG